MTSRTFRESMNSLGWSRREPDTLAGTNPSSRPILSKFKSLNPFGSGGYVQLPAQDASAAPLPAPTRREEEEGWFACESRDFPSVHHSCWREWQFLCLDRFHDLETCSFDSSTHEGRDRAKFPCFPACYVLIIISSPAVTRW